MTPISRVQTQKDGGQQQSPVTSQVSAEDARELTDRIKVTVEGAWLLIKQAYESRAWAALGYLSWDDYCTREFGASRLKLPREERQEIVASIRESGLSTRAIAAATGLARNTVKGALAQVGQSDPPAAPTPEPTPVPPRVTGTDGKSYPAPVPAAKPRGSPLADDARSAGWQFRKATERLVRIGDDDRFTANKDQVAAELRGHLVYAMEVCQDLLTALTKDSE